jgi:phage-related protein
MDDLDDRKEAEVKAAEDRFKAIEKAEKQNLEEAKIRAKMQAAEISKSAGAELAKRMQVDAVGTMMDIFKRIKSLPKEMQVSVISDFFGDETRAILPLLNNMENLEKALRLVGDQHNYAGSTAKEFATRLETTASQMQMAQNRAENLLISLGQDGGLLQIMIKAADAVVWFTTKVTDLTNKVPGLTPLVTGLAIAFIGLTATAPFIAAMIPIVQGLVGAIAGMNLVVAGAGWGTVIMVAVAGMKTALLGLLSWLTSTLLPGLVAVFSGPAGWAVLAVAAVVAMVVLFRKPLEDFVQWLWNWGKPISNFWIDLWNQAGDTARDVLGKLPAALTTLLLPPFAQITTGLSNDWKFLWNDISTIAANNGKAIAAGWQQTIVIPFMAVRDRIAQGWAELAPKITAALAGIGDWFRDKVATPIQTTWSNMIAFMQQIVDRARGALQSAWNAIAGGIQGAFRGMLGTIAGIINSIIGAIRNMIDGINNVRAAVQLGPIGKPNFITIPGYAEGGVVNRPTLAMVGEGGEQEYIIPESKMARAVSNYLAGERGGSVLTARSGPPPAPRSSSGGGMPTRSSINITTGPVQQIDGKQYATLADLESVAQQVANQIYGTLRTPAGRRAIGVA